MSPFGLTVSGDKVKVLDRIAHVRNSRVDTGANPVNDAGLQLLDFFENYVRGIPDGSQVSLSVHVSCNYTAPDTTVNRQVGP